jgi:hypothetical protein
VSNRSATRAGPRPRQLDGFTQNRGERDRRAWLTSSCRKPTTSRVLVWRLRHSLSSRRDRGSRDDYRSDHKKELSPGEIASGAVFQLDNGNLVFEKRLASLQEYIMIADVES